MRRLLEDIARWLFRTFPKQRRRICIALIVIGLLLPLPLLYYIVTGQAEDVPPGWGVPLFVTFGVGVFLLLVALPLLMEINRLGEREERM